MYAITMEGGQCLALADACNTPAPPGPLVLPYPDVGLPAMASGACTKVFVRGVPALNQASSMPLSSGDEAGTLGGVVSARIAGAVRFASGSRLVRMQGHPAVRLGDATRHNDGNAAGGVVQPSQIQLRILR